MNQPFKKLLLLGVSTFLSAMHAQDIQWEKTYGGQQADYLFDAQPTPDYGFILAGSSLSRKSGNKADNGHGDLDYWVWKMKENGDLDWQKSYGGDGADFLQTIKLTPDGGFILAGTSATIQTQGNGSENKGNTSFGGNDFWIVKLDAKGTVEWEKRYGGVGQDDLVTLSLTPDGGYIIGGSSDSPSESQTQNSDANNPNPNAKYNDSRGNMDYWILKLDRKGNVAWQKTYGGDYADLLRALIPTADGGYMVGGYSNSTQSGDKTNVNFGEGGDYWILKLNDQGIIQWQQTIGGNQDDQLNALVQTPDKGYLLGGNSNSNATHSKTSNNQDGTDFWVVKIDEKGNPLWQQTYNYGAVDILTNMLQNPDGTIMVAGYSPSTPNTSGKKATEGLDDYIALKLSDTGTVLWERKVGSNGVDMLKKVIETRDGGYLLAGTANNSPATQKVNNNKNGINNNMDFNAENQQATNLKNQANTAVSKQVSEVNNGIKNQISQANNTLGLKEDSPLKLNTDALQLNNPLTLGGDNANQSGNGNSNNNSNSDNKPLPPSRDKSVGFGSTDFWVVKLKDKTKTEKPKASIEALPNPATTFTNIIVGYEYSNGTATVVDLAGHQLASFAISNRTIPVDLNNYPEGIYIITIATNISTESIKVIKGFKN